MIKGYALVGTLILALCNTAAYAAGQPIDAKAGVVARAAAITINPLGNCSGYPLNISQPGSYLLATNITLSCGADAIDVKADNVVIDLGGYTITGTGSGSGIGINGPTHSNVTVRNGSIIKMGSDGIFLGAGATLEELTLDSNGANGAAIGSGLIHHVHANFNPQDGVVVTFAVGQSEASDCDFSANGGGVILFHSGVVARSVANNNKFFGINCDFPSVISNNTANNNGTFGLLGAGQISNNSVAGNGEAGIEAEDGTSVVGNTIVGNKLHGIAGLGLFSYGNNLLYKNDETSFPSPATQVFGTGAVQMGPNICDGVLCP